MAETDAQQIETDAKAIETGALPLDLWKKKIERQIKEEDGWRKNAREAIRVYEADDNTSVTAFNLFHANIETIVPAIYNSSPIPDVRRRFGDADPVAKQVADLTERCLSYSLDQYDFDDEVEEVARDAEIVGRGCMRVRYEPHVADDTVLEEYTNCEHVRWDRVIIGPAQSWPKVPWITFEHDLTRDELVKLNPELGETIGLSVAEKKDGDDDNHALETSYKTTTVYEVWDRATRRCFFFAKNHTDEPLLVEDDPLRLPGFFPLLKPVQPIKRRRNMIPVSPYHVYKSLLDELDKITKRIDRLIGQCRVRGLVSADIADDATALSSLEDGEYLPAKQDGGFANGKLDDKISHWPLDKIIQALQQLYVQRDQIKQTIYEVTGLSDIIRGASNANETATAQQIKTQWGSLRVQNRQKAIANLCRDAFRAKTALFAAHFDDQSLSSMSGLPATPEQQQSWPQVLQVFRSEMRTYRIDVETDSTVRSDLARSQEQMNLFLQGTAQFATAMGQVVPLMPSLLPTVVEVFTAFARMFKLGKQAEDALDQLSQMAPKLAEQAGQQNQADPAAEAEAAKQKMQIEEQQMRQQHELQKAQMEIQERQQLHQQELQHRREEHEQKLQFLAEEKSLAIQAKRSQAEIDDQMRRTRAQAASQPRDAA